MDPFSIISIAINHLVVQHAAIRESWSLLGIFILLPPPSLSPSSIGERRATAAPFPVGDTCRVSVVAFVGRVGEKSAVGSRKIRVNFPVQDHRVP